MRTLHDPACPAMILFLRGIFTAVLAALLVVTVRAGLECPLLAVPPTIASHPWFVATIADAFAGLAVAYAWLLYKETSWISRIAWLLAFLALGHLAVISYVVAELFLTPREMNPAEILTIRRTGRGWLGIVLATGGLLVTALAIPGR